MTAGTVSATKSFALLALREPENLDRVEGHEGDRRSEGVLVEVRRRRGSGRRPGYVCRASRNASAILADDLAEADARPLATRLGARGRGRRGRGAARRGGRGARSAGTPPGGRRAAEAPLSGDDRSDEQHSRDRADVPESGPEARQAPAPFGRHELRQHRVVERESELVRGVRDREAASRSRRRSRARGRLARAGPASAVAATHARVRPMTHGLRRPRGVGDALRSRGAATRTTAEESARREREGRVAEAPRSTTIQTAKVERRDVHREDGVGEVVERPASALEHGRRSRTTSSPGGRDLDAVSCACRGIREWRGGSGAQPGLLDVKSLATAHVTGS